MNDPIPMQVLQRKHDIADEKFGLLLAEILTIAKVIAQIASI